MLRKNLVIIFFILSSTFYIHQNFGKFKLSIGRWIALISAKPGDFPVSVSCIESSPEGSRIRKVYLEALQRDNSGKFIFWLKTPLAVNTCLVNEILLNKEICFLGKSKIDCLETSSYRVYLWHTQVEFLDLLRYHRDLPRKIEED